MFANNDNNAMQRLGGLIDVEVVELEFRTYKVD